jgi:hypothetical protein
MLVAAAALFSVEELAALVALAVVAQELHLGQELLEPQTLVVVAVAAQQHLLAAQGVLV